MPAHLAVFFIAGCLALHGERDLDGVTRHNRLHKPQAIKARIGQNRPFVWLHKQSCREAEQEITMRHTTWEEGVPRGGRLIHVGVKRIAREMGEGLDILKSDGAARGVQRFAQGKRAEPAGEGVRGASDFGRAWNPLLADGCEHIGAALNGGALHVVHDTSDAAHLFAAACAAWAAVNHMRERRTVACALLHRVAVVDIDAPIPRCGLRDKGGRDGRVSCDQRGD